jgi:hypothetical protein
MFILFHRFSSNSIQFYPVFFRSYYLDLSAKVVLNFAHSSNVFPAQFTCEFAWPKNQNQVHQYTNNFQYTKAVRSLEPKQKFKTIPYVVDYRRNRQVLNFIWKDFWFFQKLASSTPVACQFPTKMYEMYFHRQIKFW